MVFSLINENFFRFAKAVLHPNTKALGIRTFRLINFRGLKALGILQYCQVSSLEQSSKLCLYEQGKLF